MIIREYGREEERYTVRNIDKRHIERESNIDWLPTTCSPTGARVACFKPLFGSHYVFLSNRGNKKISNSSVGEFQDKLII